jgi:hypothetical protein
MLQEWDFISSATVLPAVMSTLELAAVQFDPKMLAQGLLGDAKLLGDVGLRDAESRSALYEGSVNVGRLICRSSSNARE